MWPRSMAVSSRSRRRGPRGRGGRRRAPGTTRRSVSSRRSVPPSSTRVGAEDHHVLPVGGDARNLEVERARGFSGRHCERVRPHAAHLSDADAVAKDPGADDEVRRRVIPILCRLAVESACRDLLMARRFARGDARGDVEAAWEEATGSREKVALALRDDRKADLGGWLDRPRRRAAMRVIGSHGHDGLARDPVGAGP